MERGQYRKLDRFRPRLEDRYELPFHYRPEEDSGQGLWKRPPTEVPSYAAMVGLS